MQTHEVIRSRRLALGLSQAELAAAVGLEVRQIGRYETGASLPSLQAARNIAGRLGVSLDELAGAPDSLSGSWWGAFHGFGPDGYIWSAQLVQRGQHLELNSTTSSIGLGDLESSETSSADPRTQEPPFQIRSELRILGDEMLGWYVIDGTNRGKGTITLHRRDDGLQGIWLTATLKHGLQTGFVALGRDRGTAQSILEELRTAGPTGRYRSNQSDA